MIAALCQLDLAWEDAQTNYRRTRALLERSPDLTGGLIILPEMMASGFSMHVDAVVEPESGPTEAFCAELAKEHQALVIAGLVHPGTNGKGKNVAVAIDPDGRRQALYQKIHPFTLGGEAKAYEAGEAVVVVEWGGFKIAPLICYDLRFPEVFRAAVRSGTENQAEVFCVIANWPNRRESHWTTLLQARAIENLAYVCGVNRCGADPHLQYSGRSLIVDPHGAVLADAGNGECVVTAELQLDAVRDWRRDFPALADMHFADQ